MTQHTFKLPNGYTIPALGYGTFRTPDGPETENAVRDAILAGYRHIDGAAVYGNEKSVGRVIKASGIDRKELFLTSKLWNDNKGYEATKAAVNQTLEDLQTDYLDLYLIHWPIAKASNGAWQEANSKSWRAMEELYNAGVIKAIGVSNFLPHHLEALFATAKVKPMVNQLEIHPGHLQEEAVAYSKEQGLLVEAWAPFANGQIFDQPLLQEIAKRYNKNVAQISLRWLLQKDILPLPKSVTPARMAANLEVFDFTISDEDMKAIDGVTGCEGSGLHPDKVDF